MSSYEVASNDSDFLTAYGREKWPVYICGTQKGGAILIRHLAVCPLFYKITQHWIINQSRFFIYLNINKYITQLLYNF